MQTKDSSAVPELVVLDCRQSVADTVARLENLVATRGLRIFARIDFAADAAREGLAMPPMVQLVFGNPRAGTPLLVAAPSIGIDLPLRILVWQEAHGAVRLAYKDPGALAGQHHAPAELAQNIAGVRVLAAEASR